MFETPEMPVVARARDRRCERPILGPASVTVAARVEARTDLSVGWYIEVYNGTSGNFGIDGYLWVLCI